ncbi:hypothetical protein BJ912DRAFT_1019133 [Pholiota molesta]|nr:hypothetical protein BJ912DRAFT_1019133 [Pholiota molesta]
MFSVEGVKGFVRDMSPAEERLWDARWEKDIARWKRTRNVSQEARPTPGPFVPVSLFQPLQTTRRSVSPKKHPFPTAPAQKDYRHGPIADFRAAYTKKDGSTNLPEGTVHVFRDGAGKPTPEELEAKVDEMSLTEALDGDSDGIMLDFAPNRSMVILKFMNPGDASEFIEAYNGKPFNSMEPEICHVVHVLSVVIDVDDTLSQSMTRLASGQGQMYELPTCPVCLERMDSAVTGLILKWGDSRCPVCRYSQNLLSSHPTTSSSARTIPFANPTSSSQSSCSSCASTTNLWICLICGNVGCGRYGQAHAQAHYQATTHLYALELETQRVWDYAGDGYVHRLIQNKADGKLVELPSAASSMGATPREGGLGPSQADALTAEKIEAIGIEYSYLLTSQLDSQRAFYDEQTIELRTQVGELKSLMETLSGDPLLIKEKQKAEHRAEKVAELARRLEKELRDERAVSEGLMKNLAKLKEKAELADKEKETFSSKVRELEEQVRDVMFFLEAKTKIEQGGGVESEAAGGSIAVPTPPPPPPSAVNGKKKKGRKR